MSAAEALRDWFASVRTLTEKSLFAIAPDGPHREAVVLDALKRNARMVALEELDRSGKMYTPLCLFLAAACRRLGLELGAGHWQAAVNNVIEVQGQLRETQQAREAIGLEIGSAALLFKREFEEVIRQSGLAGGVGFVEKEEREIALGLAVNWGLRLLLAYALECAPSNHSGRRDLGWVAGVMREA